MVRSFLYDEVLILRFHAEERVAQILLSGPLAVGPPDRIETLRAVVAVESRRGGLQALVPVLILPEVAAFRRVEEWSQVIGCPFHSARTVKAKRPFMVEESSVRQWALEVFEEELVA